MCAGSNLLGRSPVAGSEFFVLSGVQAVDGLLHKRPALTNAAIDLLRQDLEALVAENDRLALSQLRKPAG